MKLIGVAMIAGSRNVQLIWQMSDMLSTFMDYYVKLWLETEGNAYNNIFTDLAEVDCAGSYSFQTEIILLLDFILNINQKSFC